MKKKILKLAPSQKQPHAPSASSTQLAPCSHVSYIVSGRQILATMLGAETYLTHPCQLPDPAILLNHVVCVKVRHLPRCVLTAV